jgi:hypothetical protein
MNHAKTLLSTTSYLLQYTATIPHTPVAPAFATTVRLRRYDSKDVSRFSPSGQAFISRSHDASRRYAGVFIDTRPYDRPNRTDGVTKQRMSSDVIVAQTFTSLFMQKRHRIGICRYTQRLFNTREVFL